MQKNNRLAIIWSQYMSVSTGKEVNLTVKDIENMLEMRRIMEDTSVTTNGRKPNFGPGLVDVN